MQCLLLVAVDIRTPDDSSFKGPIANQGCNVIWILSYAFSSWSPLGWKFVRTFNLICFFGEGTFQKRSRDWTLGGLVWQCSLFSWNQSSGSVEITGPFSSLVTLCFILVCKWIRMNEGRNQEMQQILNRNIALFIILNCMFSAIIPSRDNLLPCSILEGDQQSDLFCTFSRSVHWLFSQSACTL